MPRPNTIDRKEIMEKIVEFKRRKKDKLSLEKRAVFRSNLFEFAYKNGQDIFNKEENILFSPLSLYLSLIILHEGAGGETKKDIARYLGLDRDLKSFYGLVYDEFLYESDRGRFLSNNLFLVNESSFQKEFKKDLEDFYQGYLYEIDFVKDQPEKILEDFIEKNTKGYFKPDLDLSKDSNLVLVNSLDYGALWLDRGFTYEEKALSFKKIDGEVLMVDSIKGTLETDYYKGEDMEILALDLEDGFQFKVAMEKDGRKPLDQIFNKKLDRGYISFELASFKEKSRLDLEEVLSKEGLGGLFKSPDFSPMLKEASRLDQIIQEAYLSLDEKGIEAISYTQMTMTRMSLMGEADIKIKIDRPFYYGLFHKDGYPIFLGHLLNI